MLKTRILTAICLFAVFFSALFYLPPVGWMIFATLVATVAAWEWGMLMGLGSSSRITLGVVLALVCAALGLLDPAAL